MSEDRRQRTEDRRQMKEAGRLGSWEGESVGNGEGEMKGQSAKSIGREGREVGKM
jgi:hypothetical protein